MTVIMRARCAVLFAFVISAGALLVAQDSRAVMASVNDTRAFLLKQRATTGYRGSIRKSILAYESGLDAHCRKVDLDLDSGDVRDRILAPIEVDDKGVALAGRWRESVPGTACNEKRTFNVQVDVTRQGLQFTPTFPGEAAGDPGLENDTLKNIEADLEILRLPAKRSCHPTVVDTRLVGAASTLSDSGIMTPWEESWYVETCGKVYIVPVTYYPDASGTSISIEADDIHPQ